MLFCLFCNLKKKNNPKKTNKQKTKKPHIYVSGNSMWFRTLTTRGRRWSPNMGEKKKLSENVFMNK